MVCHHGIIISERRAAEPSEEHKIIRGNTTKEKREDQKEWEGERERGA